MVELVPPATVDGKFQLEDKSSITVNATIKRPAPKAGGCRVEGFVRVKKVNDYFSFSSIALSMFNLIEIG